MLVIIQRRLGKGDIVLIGILCFLLDVEIRRQRKVRVSPVGLWFYLAAGASFLPELQLCRETADTQMGKSSLREKHLPQKAEMAFHFLDLPAVGKRVGKERLRYDQGKDAQGL